MGAATRKMTVQGVSPGGAGACVTCEVLRAVRVREIWSARGSALTLGVSTPGPEAHSTDEAGAAAKKKGRVRAARPSVRRLLVLGPTTQHCNTARPRAS